MQLAGVDHIEALLADVVEAGNDLLVEGLHAFAVPFVAGEIKVHVSADKPIGHAGKAPKRILDSFAKKFLTEHAVV